ncbi:MAG: glutathione S-transferase [Pseudomonadales bacterium]|nr:glutathione S-transferase [Pseudomonadales bacterium]
MRARLAIYFSGLNVEFREVILRDKPASMLEYSPKGTVPVLVLSDNQIIDQSIDIAYWALRTQDPQQLLPESLSSCSIEMDQLINENDFEFKPWLDRYKYADRYPEYSTTYYREQGQQFLFKLDQQLENGAFLFGDKISIADIAIAPFIRQFANVDKSWFDQTAYPRLQKWLADIIESDAFHAIFKKYDQWQPEHKPIFFPSDQYSDRVVLSEY